jgi:hypothetical protein
MCHHTSTLGRKQQGAAWIWNQDARWLRPRHPILIRPQLTGCTDILRTSSGFFELWDTLLTASCLHSSLTT